MGSALFFTSLGILVSFGILLVVARFWFARTGASGETVNQRFLKDIFMPLATPLAGGILGIGIALYQDEQQGIEEDQQKKAELLREVIASQDRPGVAFLTAVGDKLVLHLERRQDVVAKKPEGWEEKKKEEEIAAYFFFGMFRAAVTDFHATKGYQLYPRLWMEEAFLGLVRQVISLGYDGLPETDPRVSVIEESALYKHFGQAAGIYKTIADRPGEPKKATVLFDFIRLIRNPNPGSNVQISDLEREHFQRLREGFEDFRKRLDKGCLKGDLQVTIDALTALDDYAFNKLFATWYQAKNSPDEVQELGQEIPGKVEGKPPRDFYFYPFSNRDEASLDSYRERLWEKILEHVSEKFGGKRPKAGTTNPPAPARK